MESSKFRFVVIKEKIKNLYDLRYDNTAIDKLLVRLKKHLHDRLVSISVRGLDTGKNDFYFKQNPYTFKQVALYWESKELITGPIRQYYIKLYVDRDKVPLRVCNMDWIKGYDESLEIGKEEDFNFNIELAYDLMEEVLVEETKCFMVSAFCGYNPSSSWTARAYFKLIVEIKVGAHDLFLHSGLNNLTDFGKNHLDEVRKSFLNIINVNKIDINQLFLSKSKVLEISRKAENQIRNNHNIRAVGDAYVNELLLANIIQTIFPDSIRQYRAKWLGKYIIDIFIPSKNIAVEYQGEQHYKPVKRFGGENKLNQQKLRDDIVRQKCKQNGIILIEWPYYDKVTEETVKKVFQQYVK